MYPQPSHRDSVKSDGGRGDSVLVNGVRRSLDLVALIAYFKLKKKCQGEITEDLN